MTLDDDATKEKKKREQDKRDFYTSFGQAMDLSWRIALTGVVIAGAIYGIVYLVTPKKGGLEKTLQNTTHESVYVLSYSNYNNSR